MYLYVCVCVCVCMCVYVCVCVHTHQNGAYRHSLIDGWLAVINESAVSAIVMAHEDYSAWWDSTTMEGKWGRYSNTHVYCIHACIHAYMHE